MKLITISIERFGARSNLHLENLSPHLNVVYGPNGSGKTTITQFVRWMLFGSEDAGSQRYLMGGDHRLGGALQIEDGSGRRKTLARHLQAAHHDYVRVIGVDGEEGYAFDSRRLTGIDLAAWQQVFSFGFDQPPTVEYLLRAAQDHSFTVTFDESQLQRLREMLQRLEEMRREQPWSAGDDHAYAMLTERRRQLRSEMDACERRRAEELRERERELAELLAEIAGEQRRLDDARQVLQRTESYLAARSREADEATAAAWSQRERWLASRREELSKLDEQIQQWHQMLGRIRQRHEALQTQMAHGGSAAVLAGRLDEADLRAALLSLGHALNDIDEDLRNGGVQGSLAARYASPRGSDPRPVDSFRASVRDTGLPGAANHDRAGRYEAELLAEGVDDAGRADYYRDILAAAWQSMRDDVHRLCRELQNQQQHAQYAEQARELDHLRRCDAELTSLIEALDRRRVSLRATPELLLRSWGRPASPTSDRLRPPTLDSASREPHWFDEPSLAPRSGPRVRDASTPEGWTDYRESLNGAARAERPWNSPQPTKPVEHGGYGLDRDLDHELERGRPVDDRVAGGDAGYREFGANGRAHDSANNSAFYSAHYRVDMMQHRSTPSYSGRNGHANWNPLPATASASEALGRERDPVWQARLEHLARRRDFLAARVRELEGRVRSLEARRDSLQGRWPGSDIERSLEALRLELVSVEDRMRHLEASQRRREEMRALERQIEQLRQQLAPSEILRDASSFLARFTCGTHRAVRVSERLQVTVEDDRGQWLDQQVLSRGTRDQTYLALALALVSAFRRRGVELPLVLNDIFIHIDGDRAEATAGVLAEFAAQGHQVILFSHQEESLQRFGGLGARLYTLRERPRPLDAPTVRSAPTMPPAPTWNVPRGYAERLYLDSATSLPVPPTAARPLASPGQVETGRVTEQSRLAEVEWLEVAVVDRCVAAGVLTVGDFLTLDAEEATRQFALRGWDEAEMLGSQSRLMLQCFVGLSPSDASLLVACGVDDPEELAYVDVSELHRRIEMFLANGEARARYGSIARFERSRLARWIQAARRSHYRRHRSKAVASRRAEVTRGQLPVAEVARPDVTPHEVTRVAGTRDEVVRAETPRGRAAADSPELRVARPRRPEAAPVARPEAAPVARAEAAPVARAEAGSSTPADSPREVLRFFLAPSDPLVDAPSIGPKTAERFHAIGLETVGQLLEVDAAEAAQRINYRRITTELVQSWQQQTELVCRVPNLRGHDAQILVACDVVSAEQLAEQDAETLNGRVQEYIGSVEGRRVLRGAKTPELPEVAAWIRWARHARQRTAQSV